MMTGRASSSIIFLIPWALRLRLKKRSYLGLMNRRFRSRYLIRFNARKICDIIDLNQGISPREKKAKSKNSLLFERYLQDISLITNRYLIKTLILFKKYVDLLNFLRYHTQKVKIYYRVSWMIDSNRLSLEEYYFLHEHGQNQPLN